MTNPQTAIQVKSEDQEITITFDDVRRYLCNDCTDAEIGLFLKVAASENLNPFRKDCYLVKYSKDQPASIIISTDVFIRSAESNPEFDGYEAGIILKPIDPKEKPEFREGAFLMDGEESRLAGGYAKVFRKDRQQHPFYIAVNIKECMKYTKYGKPTRFWEDMPATMVRKVALSRALREAFSIRYSGTYTTAEIEPPEEGELPPALEKGGKPDWKHFWTKVKSELGLTTEQARELLRVDSIKEELIDQGVSMEKIWDSLVNALQRQKEAAMAEQVVDAQTGEIITQDENLFGEEEDAGAAAPEEAHNNEEPTGTAAPAKLKRDPETIKTINDLLRACHQDFGMQPAVVYKELGYKSQADINEKPSVCYQRIAADVKERSHS